MNELVMGSELTMSSKELADLLDARHSDVIRSIENQLPKVGCTLHPHTLTNKQNGQNYLEYTLNKRESLIIASGYSVELRTKIIDRWIELENKNKPLLPKTFSEALRLAADQADQIELMKPKVESFDKFLSAENWQTMNEVAHILHIGRNILFKNLRQADILMSNNIPKQQYMDKGYFKVIEKSIDMGGKVINKPQTLVSAKGVEFINWLDY